MVSWCCSAVTIWTHFLRWRWTFSHLPASCLSRALICSYFFWKTRHNITKTVCLAPPPPSPSSAYLKGKSFETSRYSHTKCIYWEVSSIVLTDTWEKLFSPQAMSVLILNISIKSCWSVGAHYVKLWSVVPVQSQSWCKWWPQMLMCILINHAFCHLGTLDEHLCAVGGGPFLPQHALIN